MCGLQLKTAFVLCMIFTIYFRLTIITAKECYIFEQVRQLADIRGAFGIKWEVKTCNVCKLMLSSTTNGGFVFSFACSKTCTSSSDVCGAPSSTPCVHCCNSTCIQSDYKFSEFLIEIFRFQISFISSNELGLFTHDLRSLKLDGYFNIYKVFTIIFRHAGVKRGDVEFSYLLRNYRFEPTRHPNFKAVVGCVVRTLKSNLDMPRLKEELLDQVKNVFEISSRISKGPFQSIVNTSFPYKINMMGKGEKACPRQTTRTRNGIVVKWPRVATHVNEDFTVNAPCYGTKERFKHDQYAVAVCKRNAKWSSFFDEHRCPGGSKLPLIEEDMERVKRENTGKTSTVVENKMQNKKCKNISIAFAKDVLSSVNTAIESKNISLHTLPSHGHTVPAQTLRRHISCVAKGIDVVNNEWQFNAKYIAQSIIDVKENKIDEPIVYTGCFDSNGTVLIESKKLTTHNSTVTIRMNLSGHIKKRNPNSTNMTFVEKSAFRVAVTMFSSDFLYDTNAVVGLFEAVRDKDQTVQYALTKKINSWVVAIDVFGLTNLLINITISFRQMIAEDAIQPSCSKWIEDSNQMEGMRWLDFNCTLGYNRDDGVITCQCVGIGTYALRMNVMEESDTKKSLTTSRPEISVSLYIGMGAMTITSLLALVIFIVKRRFFGQHRFTIVALACLCNAVTGLVFVVGMQDSILDSRASCTLIAAVLHFMLLVSLCWLMMDAFEAAWGSIWNEPLPYLLVFSFFVAWWVPTIFLLITIFNNGVYESYGMTKTGICWMFNDAFLQTCFTPFVLITVVTVVSYSISVTRYCGKGRQMEFAYRILLSASIYAFAFLACIFLFFAVITDKIAYYYLFCILGPMFGISACVMFVMSMKISLSGIENVEEAVKENDVDVGKDTNQEKTAEVRDNGSILSAGSKSSLREEKTDATQQESEAETEI